MTKVDMTPLQFLQYSAAEMTAAAAEPTREAATKRVEHLRKVSVIAKAAFEQTGAGDKSVVSIEIEEAYVGSAGAGSAADLTTKADQKVVEMPAAGGNEGTGDSAMAQNAIEVIGKTSSALVAMLAGTPDPGGANSAIAKSASEPFAWPLDMARDEAETAAADKRAGIQKQAPPDDSWGTDPWKATNPAL